MWYQYQSQVTGNVSFGIGSPTGFDPVVEIISTNGSFLATSVGQLGCSTTGTVVVCAVVVVAMGETYLVRVSSPINTDVGAFDVLYQGTVILLY